MITLSKEKLISFLDEIAAIPELKEITGTEEETERLRNRLSDDEFRIAVVGEFSSGKSTFINAFLGKDILKHAAIETTAAVTRIVNVGKDDPKIMTGRVKLRSGEELNMADLSELKDYTTTQSQRYVDTVPEQIESVEIFIHFADIDVPIAIVDTPGLNGMAKGHMEQTIALIQKAHACVYMIPRTGLNETAVEFLQYLTSVQRNFIFVQNFKDDLNADEGDTIESKISEQREILEKDVFSNAPDCKYEICGVSSLFELASADTDYERLYYDSDENLTPERRVKLHEESGFEDFRALMDSNFAQDNIDEIRYGGTARALCNWAKKLYDRVENREKYAREMYEMSSDKQYLDKLELGMETLEKRRDSNRKKLENMVTADGEDIKDEEKENIIDDFNELRALFTNEIESLNDAGAIDDYALKLQDRLDGKMDIVQTDISRRIRQRFQILYQSIEARVDEYCDLKMIRELDIDAPKLQVSVSGAQITADYSKLQQRQRQLDQAQSEADQLQRKDGELRGLIQSAANSAQSLESQKRSINADRDREISNLGRRPDVREYERTEIVDVYRGGLGFLDWLLGPKKVRRTYTERDSSARDAWDKRERKIKNSYNSRRNEIENQISAAETQMRKLENERSENRANIKSKEKQIERLKDELEKERARQNEELKRAKEEYVKKMKTDLLKTIDRYFSTDSDIFKSLISGVTKSVDETVGKFIKMAQDMFDKTMKEKEKWHALIRQQKSPEILKEAENLSEICGVLQNIINQTEGAVQ